MTGIYRQKGGALAVSDDVPLGWVTEIDREARRYVVLFPQGDKYKFFGLNFRTHLFGVGVGRLLIDECDKA